MKNNWSKDAVAFLLTALIFGVVAIGVGSLDLSGLPDVGKELVYIAVAIVLVVICHNVPLLRGSQPLRRDVATWRQWRRERAERGMRFMVGFFALVTVGSLIAMLANFFTGADGATTGSVYLEITCFSAIMLAISIILWLASKRVRK